MENLTSCPLPKHPDLLPRPPSNSPSSSPLLFIHPSIFIIHKKISAYINHLSRSLCNKRRSVTLGASSELSDAAGGSHCFPSRIFVRIVSSLYKGKEGFGETCITRLRWVREYGIISLEWEIGDFRFFFFSFIWKRGDEEDRSSHCGRHNYRALIHIGSVWLRFRSIIRMNGWFRTSSTFRWCLERVCDSACILRRAVGDLLILEVTKKL